MPRRWVRLKSDIAALRSSFLPPVFDPLGSYPNPELVQAHTRAFLVLSHAEVESYIEDWAKEIARAAEDVWTNSKRIAAPLAFLVATVGERVSEADSLSSQGGLGDSHARFSVVVAKTFPIFYKRIKDNNGVKEKNVLRLFAPLGVPSTAFTSTLLPNLDALGAIRGEHAHYSAKAVQSVLDPESEHKRLEAILRDLLVFEVWLGRYKRTIL